MALRSRIMEERGAPENRWLGERKGDLEGVRAAYDQIHGFGYGYREHRLFLMR